MSGGPERLAFLRESHARHADFFGAPRQRVVPLAALVHALGPMRCARSLTGYAAGSSSATPQRFPALQLSDT